MNRELCWRTYKVTRVDEPGAASGSGLRLRGAREAHGDHTWTASGSGLRLRGAREAHGASTRRTSHGDEKPNKFRLEFSQRKQTQAELINANLRGKQNSYLSRAKLQTLVWLKDDKEGVETIQNIC